MKLRQYLFGFLMLTCLLVWACTDDEGDQAGFTGDPIEQYRNFPFDNLSDYGFFEGPMSDLRPAEVVLPYKLNSALFSNYALKHRMVYLPDDQTAVYTDAEQVVDFPVGSILVKTFYYLADFRDENSEKNILETRLLVNQPDGWEAYEYIWNDDQTEATHTLVGRQFPVSWIHSDGTERTANYQIPNKIECQDCHSFGNQIVPIGPKARNLNGFYDYSDGTVNQLDKWIERGWLTGLPASPARLPDYTDPSDGDLNSRARAYLDINCAHCHYPGAPADNSGLFLNFENDESIHLGICKPAVAAGGGSGGYRYDIVPGNPEESILTFRMQTLDLDKMMPETGRSVVHDEGLQLISDWIAAMDGPACD